LSLLNFSALNILLLTTIMYFITIGIMVSLQPQLLGISRNEMNENTNKVKIALKEILRLKKA
ncbi:MAG: hypothetical protein ACK40V_04235, partial [Anaerolineales bacterium]